MACAYSSDLRERVLRACEAGNESQTAIARRFEVSSASVSSWFKQARETGRRQAKAHGGGWMLLNGDLDALAAEAAAHPDGFLHEFARWVEERTGHRHSLPALCRALRRLGWRRKKSLCTPVSRSVRMFKRSVRSGAINKPPGPLKS